jgi:hypothetical protein
MRKSHIPTDVNITVSQTFVDRIQEQLLQFPSKEAIELFNELDGMVMNKIEIEAAIARAKARS